MVRESPWNSQKEIMIGMTKETISSLGVLRDSKTMIDRIPCIPRDYKKGTSRVVADAGRDQYQMSCPLLEIP